MSVVINGTSGISGVDGSAGTPAVQGTDTNTGILFPATDTVAIATNGTEQMRVDSSGNVGIGTTAGITTVSSGLAINNATAANYPGLEIQTAGVTRMYINANNVVSYIASVGTSPLVTYTNGSERMRIDSSGNVGIGTSSPSQKLTVKTTDGGGVAIQNAAGTEWRWAVNADNSFACVSTGVAERMRIDSSGNVGIGTSSPAQKLDVVGTLRLTNTGTPANFGTLSDGGGLVITSGNSNPMYFYVGGSERMRITSNGGVSFGSSGTAYGSSGQVLVSNGDTAPTWGSAIVSGTAQATTSGTTKDFTGIPSWVKRITVMFNGVSTSGSSHVIVQIGSGSITTSGYISNAFYVSPAVSTSSYTNGFGTAPYGAASDSRTSLMNISLMGSNNWVCASTGINPTNTTCTGSSGYVALSGTLDRVRVTTVNGTDTFDAGSVNILYE